MTEYSWNFGAYPTGQPPSNWTQRLQGSDVGWSVDEDASAIGGKTLTCMPSTGGDQILSPDEVDGSDDQEVVIKVSGGGASTGSVICVVRASGTGGVDEHYYGVRNNNADDSFQLYKIKNGSGGFTSLGATAASFYAQGTFYWIRLRANGTTISFKAWEDGASEPGAWTASVTDSDLTGGFFGPGTDRSGNLLTVDFMGAATGGDTAPTSVPEPVTIEYTADFINKKTANLSFTSNFLVAVLGDLNFSSDVILKDVSTVTFTSDAYLQLEIAGFTSDFVAFDAETKQFTSDFSVVDLGKTVTFTSDTYLTLLPHIDFTSDFRVFQGGVVTFDSDVSIVNRSLVEFLSDLIVKYGPDIEISLGELMAKWDVKGEDMRVTSLTREYYRVPVYAEEEGVQIDPTTYTVEFALTENDDDGQPVEPTDDQWASGSWETNTAVEPNIYYAQILLGAGGAIELADGNYHIWWKISASTEAPVRLLGRVDVT